MSTATGRAPGAVLPKKQFLRVPLAVWLSLLVFAALAGASYLTIFGAMLGSKTYVAMGLFIAVAAPLIYLAVEKPFIFPFGLFVLLAPVDPLLNLSQNFGTLTKLIAMAAGAAFVLWLVRYRRFIKLDKAAFFWVLLVVWMALSVFWAIDQDGAATRVTTFAQLIVLYLAVSLMPVTESQHKAFLTLVALSGIVGAAGSLYLYENGAFVLHSITHGVQSTRLDIKFADSSLNPDGFSVSLILPAAITLMWAAQRQWSIQKVGLIGLFMVMVGGIYINGARAAFLALFTLIAYMIVRSRFRAQLLTLSLVAFACSFLPPISIWARFSTAFSSGGSGRTSIWLVGWEAFKRHWLVGAGVGNFADAYNQAFISVYQRIYASWSRAPHNIIVEVCVELGVIGLMIFLAAWYVQMRSLRVIGRSDRLYDIRIMLEGALLALFVQGFFTNLMGNKVTWILFILIAATRALALSQAQLGLPATPVVVPYELTPTPPPVEGPVHA